MGTMTVYGCPDCGQTNRLGTLESLVGNAYADFIDDDIEHQGETEISWDSTTTIGYCCDSCGWSIETGEPHTEVLVPVE